MLIINGQHFDTWPRDVNLFKFPAEVGRIVKQLEKSRKLDQYVIVKWNREEAATWTWTWPLKFWFEEHTESFYHMRDLTIQPPITFFFFFLICLLHIPRAAKYWLLDSYPKAPKIPDAFLI